MGTEFNWLERRFLPLAFLIPIVGVVFTFTELRYLAFGEIAEGTITSVEDVEGERGGEAAVVARAVHVEFVDASNDQTESAVGRVGRSWEPDGETIEVQYIPGRTVSGRLASERHPWIAISILVATVLITILAIKFGLEANRPISRRR